MQGPGSSTRRSTSTSSSSRPTSTNPSSSTSSSIRSGSSEEELTALGLRAGEPVRFRKFDGGRWWTGRMSCVAADGSFTIYDTDGAARSLRPERLEVRRPAAGGRLTWQLLSDVAVTWEQLELW